MNANKSVFTNEEAYKIYNSIYKWLISFTPGEYTCLSRYKKYQKQAWNIVLQKYELMAKKSKLLKEELDFLNDVIYVGNIYRIQNYHCRDKKYVKEMPFYCASWSKSLKEVCEVSNLNGEVLLIVAKTSCGIDTFGLIKYIWEHNAEYIFYDNNIRGLLRYEKEGEILNPINFLEVESIVAVNHYDLPNWSTNCKVIDKSKWGRKNFR